MKNTSERHIINSEFQNEAEYYIHLVHIATYEFASKYVKGKRVLDYGCGSGYGSYILSSLADNVTGVDISIEAVDFAKINYSANNLNFKHNLILLHRSKLLSTFLMRTNMSRNSVPY